MGLFNIIKPLSTFCYAAPLITTSKEMPRIKPGAGGSVNMNATFVLCRRPPFVEILCDGIRTNFSRIVFFSKLSPWALQKTSIETFLCNWIDCRRIEIAKTIFLNLRTFYSHKKSFFQTF